MKHLLITDGIPEKSIRWSNGYSWFIPYQELKKVGDIPIFGVIPEGDSIYNNAFPIVVLAANYESCQEQYKKAKERSEK